MPQRVQLHRSKGWRKPTEAIVVARPTRWGNPFVYRTYQGLVRYRPSAPDEWEYEGRISAAGNRHDFYYPDGSVTEFWVRYATRAELVEMYRQTLFEPTAAMVSAYPSRRGHFLTVGVEDIREELAGWDLACWCKPDQPCHADVLLEVANG